MVACGGGSPVRQNRLTVCCASSSREVSSISASVPLITITCMTFCPLGLLVGSKEGQILLFSVPRSTKLSTYHVHFNPVCDLAVLPSGDKTCVFVSAQNDGGVHFHLWTLYGAYVEHTDNYAIRSPSGNKNELPCFSTASDSYVAVSMKHTVDVWNLTRSSSGCLRPIQTPLHMCIGHNGRSRVISLCLSPGVLLALDSNGALTMLPLSSRLGSNAQSVQASYFGVAQVYQMQLVFGNIIFASLDASVWRMPLPFR